MLKGFSKGGLHNGALLFDNEPYNRVPIGEDRVLCIGLRSRCDSSAFDALCVVALSVVAHREAHTARFEKTPFDDAGLATVAIVTIDVALSMTCGTRFIDMPHELSDINVLSPCPVTRSLKRARARPDFTIFLTDAFIPCRGRNA